MLDLPLNTLMMEFNDERYCQILLGNGIRCVLRRVKSNVAYASLSINAGARDGVCDGVAHLTEHLIFRGTQKFSAYEISKRLESRGGDLNAYTGKEETVVHTVSLKNDLTRALELLKEMVFFPKFNQKDIDAEKEIIVDEINSYKDSPSELIYDEFEELIFSGSAIGKSILGTKRGLHKISRNDIVTYTDTNFATNNMVISVCGDFTESKFRELCQRSFDCVESKSRTNTRTTPVQVEMFDVIKNKKTHQVHSIIGGYAPKIDQSERVQMAMLCNMLAGPSAMSLLNQELREKRSITYNVEASYTPYSDCGFFAIYFSCVADKRNNAIEIINKEFSNIASGTINDAKFERFKKQFLGQLIISNENQESMMLAVAKSLLMFGEFEKQEAIYKKIDSITKNDVIEIAKAVLDTKNISSLTYL